MQQVALDSSEILSAETMIEEKIFTTDCITKQNFTALLANHIQFLDGSTDFCPFAIIWPYSIAGFLFGVWLWAFYFIRQKTRITNKDVRWSPKSRKPECSLSSQMNLSSHIMEQFNDIAKSPEDKREYRGLLLKNGLKILLISDPTTDQSAASMDVNVGSMQDPWELPGLAHFCEHMLFLGTGKYPIENEYAKYLSNHSGDDNAFTNCDHTNFYFDISPEHLDGAVDRIQNDGRRLYQITRSISNPKHAFAKFGTGNRKTLMDDAINQGLDLRSELLKFYASYYSANLMCFCILGKESLDELSSLVVDRLGIIQNNNLKPPEWPVHPFDAERLGYWLNVVPVKDIRELRIMFPIPDLSKWYRSKPGDYIAHLIGHEGHGSLLSELKRRGWCSSLNAYSEIPANGFGFFNINTCLSELGMNHVEDIVRMIFQYIELIRISKPQEWIHREIQDLNEIQFRFQDKQTSSTYVSNLVSRMHQYPMEEVLKGPYLMPDFRPDLIEIVMDHLKPQFMIATVVSKLFDGKTSSTEEWYGSNFHIERISPKFMNELNSIAVSDAFKLPFKNKFIPTNFEVKKIKSAESSTEFPEVIENTPLNRVWFKQDDEYFLPKNYIFVKIRSPAVFKDPLAVGLSRLFVDLVEDELTEFSYDASLAGLYYDLDVDKYGIEIQIGGYHEKQMVLLENIVEKLSSLKPDPQRFEILKEIYVRSLKNFKMEKPHEHASYYRNLVLSERNWSKDELLAVHENLSFDRLQTFLPQLFSEIHIEAFVHGNSSKEEALNAVELIKNVLKRHYPTLKSLHPSQLLLDREIELPDGKAHYYEANNEIQPDSALEFYLQCGVQETRATVLVELLVQMLHEPFYSTLRTKEQLGYIVESNFMRSRGTQGIRFLVQSDKALGFVETRVEAFLAEMHNYLEQMSANDFERHVTALAASRLQRPKRLFTLASKYWSEITCQYFKFDRDRIEVNALKAISKEELFEFFEKSIKRESPQRKLLTIHVVSSQTDREENMGTECPPEANRRHAAKITHIEDFKQRHALYPRPAPAIPLPYPESDETGL